jgi:glycosyltransferase involved in cell wall biosynthesis
VKSLFAQETPLIDFEIIVVVDGSTDGTSELLRTLTLPCKFRVIEQENQNLAGARNSGYRAATSDLILFLDDDMLCDPGLLATHLQAHEESGRIVAFVLSP